MRLFWLAVPVQVLVLATAELYARSHVYLRNDSDLTAKVEWVDPGTGQRAFMYEMIPGAQNELHSYVGHLFEIVETGFCEKDGNCLSSIFKVSKAVDQAFVLGEDFQVTEVKDLASAPKKEEISPDHVLKKCRLQTKRRLQNATPNDKELQEQVRQELHACIQKGLVPAIRRAKDEINYQRSLRETVARDMENFTCTDPDLDTSPDVETRDWTSEKDGKTRVVHVKLNRPASRIHVIEDFAYKEECEAMEAKAKDKLHRAATADGKGGSHVSEHRKAMQAGITPSWSKEAEGDLVVRLSRRVYDYVNYELGLNLEEHGQEPLMSIQYFGRGYNDTTPDRYTPHCDGPCEGEKFLDGSRMATMVIYCEIPVTGGHTNFQNANVHVKPQTGSAIFFSYIDPITNLTDKS